MLLCFMCFYVLKPIGLMDVGMWLELRIGLIHRLNPDQNFTLVIIHVPVSQLPNDETVVIFHKRRPSTFFRWDGTPSPPSP